jgi:hypothetical protein
MGDRALADVRSACRSLWLPAAVRNLDLRAEGEIALPLRSVLLGLNRFITDCADQVAADTENEFDPGFDSASPNRLGRKLQTAARRD